MNNFEDAFYLQQKNTGKSQGAASFSLGSTSIPASPLQSPKSPLGFLSLNQQLAARNGTGTKYLMNATIEQPLMSSTEVNAQRKNLSFIMNQHSHLKEQYRHLDISFQNSPLSLPTSLLASTQMFKDPSTKSKLQNYQGKAHRQTSSQNISRSVIHSSSSTKAFPLTGLIEDKLQAASQYESRKQLSSSMNLKTSNSMKNMNIPLMGEKILQLNNMNEAQKKLREPYEIKDLSLQRGYVERLENLWKERDQKYEFVEFKNLVHNFLVNEAIIQNEFPQQRCDRAGGEQREQEQEGGGGQFNIIDQDDKIASSKSTSRLDNKSNRVSISLPQEKKRVKSEMLVDTALSNTSSTSAIKISEILTQQPPYKVRFTKLIKEEEFEGIEQPGQEDNSQGVSSQKQLQLNKEQPRNQALSKSTEKENLTMMLIDFLVNIQDQFTEGTQGRFYPQLGFMQDFMKKLMEISNKVCEFLMKKNEKAVSIFVQSILRMFTQIFEKQYRFIKQEVISRVNVEVSDMETKLELQVKQNKELISKIKTLRDEQEKQLKEFQQKILVIEELKNTYMERAEILKDEIEESKTKKYKDYQLERIQAASKELTKQYMMINSECLKRGDLADEGLLSLARLSVQQVADTALMRNDPRQKQFASLYQQQSSPQSGQSQNYQVNSFSDLQPISFAQKYDHPESKAAFLFAHPFSFYLVQDLPNYAYDKLSPKLTKDQIIILLETFLDEETALKQDGTKLNAPANFITKILSEQSNFFKATIRVSEVSLMIQSLYQTRKDIGVVFALIFGLFQDNMLTDSQFEFLVQIRKIIKLAVLPLNEPANLTESQVSQLCEDTLYVPQKLVIDAFTKILDQILQERLKQFLSTRRAQINQKAIDEQQKLTNSRFFSESSLVLIPNLMQNLKTENINDVIRSMENIFDKLDPKKNDKANYPAFKRLMNNHFNIDTENQSFAEYFQPFITGDVFNYPGFMQKVTNLHVPDALNEKLISYYQIMSEICNIMILTQTQAFHNFKNRLSNLLFSHDQLETFNFKLLEDFFAEYEDDKDNKIKYNTKRLSAASVYRWLFNSNDFNVLYQSARLKGIDNDTLSKLYPQQQLLSNFEEYMEYMRDIYSFLSVQEKITIVQNIQPRVSDVSSAHSVISGNQVPKLFKSKGIATAQSTLNQLKTLKSIRLTQQNSNSSVKSLPQQKLKKSLFQSSQMSLNQSNVIEQDSNTSGDQPQKDIPILDKPQQSKMSLFSGM